MTAFFRMVLVILLCWHLPAFVVCHISCLELRAVASSFSSSSACCQCTQQPISYQCPNRCQHNMYPADSLTICAAGVVITSTVPALDMFHVALPLRARGFARSTSGTNTGEGPPTERPPSPPGPVRDTANRSAEDEAPALLTSVHTVSCRPCHRACDGCTGAGPHQCLQCSEGYRRLCKGTDDCECKMVLAAPHDSTTTSTFTLSVVSLAMSSIVVVMAVVTVALVLVWRHLRQGRLRMPKRKPEKTPHPAYMCAMLADAGDDVHESRRPLYPPWNADDVDCWTIYDEIDTPCNHLELHPVKVSSLPEDGKETRISQGAGAEPRNLARIDEKLPLLGRGASPKTDRNSLLNTSIRSQPYCDYRMATCCPKSKELSVDDETNPKQPSQETVQPVTIGTAAVRDSGDGKANAPPLPPRNTDRNMEEETTLTEVSCTTVEVNCCPVAESTAECERASSIEQDKCHGGSSGKDVTLPKPWTATGKTGTQDGPCLSETPRFHDLSDQDTHRARNGSEMEEYVSSGRQPVEHLDNSDRHADWNRSQTSNEEEGGWTHRYVGTDITTYFPILAEPELRRDSLAESSILCVNSDSEYPWDYVPFKLTEDGSSHSRTVLYADSLSTSVSSQMSSLERSSTYVCSVSNVSSSSGYDSQPCARSRSLEERQISWTLAEVYSSPPEEEKTQYLYSCRPLPRRTNFADVSQFLRESVLKKSPSYEDRLQRTEKMNMLSTYILSSATQTAGPCSAEDCRPTFSPTWQKEQAVSHHGGVVHTHGSAVRLEIPPGAVPPGESVTIKAAISTKLNLVYSKLPLSNTEHISSPVAEYHAGTDFRFCKPVKIVLPHFLPARYSPEQVNVYVFHAAPTGELSFRKLQLRSKDNETVQDKDVFSFVDGKKLEIFTDHFSGYLCSYCQSSCQVQELRLVLFARPEQKANGCAVDVRLEIWDNRLDVPDFEQACFHRQRTVKEENMLCIDRKSLCPPEDDVDMHKVKIGCELDLNTDVEEEQWSHVQRRLGQLMYPVRQIIPLKSVFPCECNRPDIPKRVDWKLTQTSGTASPDLFNCLVDVGYIVVDQPQVLDRPFDFLKIPGPVTIDVAVSSARIQEAKDNYRGMVDDSNSFMWSTRLTQTMIRNNLRDGQSCTDTQPKQWSSATMQTPETGAAAARAPAHTEASLNNVSDFIHQRGPGTERGMAFPDLDRSAYVRVDDLQAAGFRPSPRDGAESQGRSTPNMSSITIINKAATVNVLGSQSSMEGSSTGDSFSSSYPAAMSTSSSASSDTVAKTVRPRRPHSLHGRFEVTQRAFEILACNSPGEDDSSEHYGYLESDHSDYERADSRV